MGQQQQEKMKNKKKSSLPKEILTEGLSGPKHIRRLRKNREKKYSRIHECVRGLPRGSDLIKASACNARDVEFNPWVKKILEEEMETHPSIPAWRTP